MFQSTRPRGARRRPRSWSPRSTRFNPRAHVGRDSTDGASIRKETVSIHAPTWGATPILMSHIEAIKFQSTRPRGARRRTGDALVFRACFNPRAHVGRDRGRSAGKDGGGFQSTRPRGARLGHGWSVQEIVWFQSTRPRGARLSSWPPTRKPASFNPRAHVGRDNELSHDRFPLPRFQSTRPRGARHRRVDPLNKIRSFNPRAHVGRDRLSAASCLSCKSFNPRAHVGRDMLSTLAAARAAVSIHAPTWGATAWFCIRASPSSFNPRAHVGRDTV